jgi:hypothetical protein
VAAAQTAESRASLRAACLFATLVSAKVVTLLGADLPLSVWAAAAYFWQDILIATVFFMADTWVKRDRIGWAAYAAIVVYVAVNVPVTRVLSTPLTWTMIRASGGALTDSIAHYVTLHNLAALAVPLAVAATLPWLLRRWTLAIGRRTIAVAGIVAAVGCAGVARIDTRGLHRSAVGALVATFVPRVVAAPGTVDWRSSPFAAGARQSLMHLAGSLAGRNVVLILLESTGARHLGAYGAPRDPTPNLTALAQNGIVFDRAYSVYPESIKGLFATLCSRYPAFDVPPEALRGVPCVSLARSLKDAGYRTSLFHSGRFMYLGMEAVIRDRGFDLLEDAGAIGGRVHSSFGVDEASTVDRMLRWIDSLDGKDRFFLSYMPIAGHHPYSSAGGGPFEGTGDFIAYLNALHEGDEALGQLLDGLRERRLDQNTVFIVFGDHGEAFGEHPGNFAHTLFIYDENVRVPYVIAAPGRTIGQIRVERTASIIDTAPTVLHLLGLGEPAGHQGSSLLRPEPRMALFYTDYSLGWLGLTDACWKYLHQLDTGRSQLFDTCADPTERYDRAAEFPNRVDAYRDRVKAWASAQRDRLVEHEKGGTH